jgi:hypothetical protein
VRHDLAALQLRLLQTVAEVAAEKNSTLVMPLPVVLLRFLQRATNHDRHDLQPGLPTPEPVDDVPAPSSGCRRARSAV